MFHSVHAERRKSTEMNEFKLVVVVNYHFTLINSVYSVNICGVYFWFEGTGSYERLTSCTPCVLTKEKKRVPYLTMVCRM